MFMDGMKRVGERSGTYITRDCPLEVISTKIDNQAPNQERG
jgi:hypothetical protein